LIGGPGGVKQFFLKTLGDKIRSEGYCLEYLHSSLDFGSYAGLSIPALKIAYIDGSESRFLKPEFPGISGNYLSFDEYYARDSLAGQKETVKALSEEYHSFISKAYSYLAAAGKSSRDIFKPLFSDSIAETILRRAAGICSREFSETGNQGFAQKRFLSAFTYEGIISRFDTVKTLCSRVCIIDNEFGFAPYMLSELLANAVRCGYEVVVCPSPLYPEQPEHILIPELSLAFLSITCETPYNFETFKHVRLDALVDKEKYRELKLMLREESKILELLLEKARQNLLYAKSAADRIDALYSSHIDFEGVNKLAEKHAEIIKKL
jgi:hypothetical protein